MRTPGTQATTGAAPAGADPLCLRSRKPSRIRICGRRLGLDDNSQARSASSRRLLAGDLYQHIVAVQDRRAVWLMVDPFTLEFIPLLAESYEVSTDGLTIKFQLRQA
jgi:ABC-type transport system substrate-binding protein